MDKGKKQVLEEAEAVPRASALYRFWQIFKGAQKVLLALATALSKNEFRTEFESRECAKAKPLREHVLLGLEALQELWGTAVGNPSRRKSDWVAWLKEKILAAVVDPEFWRHYYVKALKAGLAAWSSPKHKVLNIVPDDQDMCYTVQAEGCIRLYLGVDRVGQDVLRFVIYQLACKLDEATTHFLLKHLSSCEFSVSETTGGDHYFVGPIIRIGFDMAMPECLVITAPKRGWLKAPEGFLEHIQGLVVQKLPGATIVAQRSPDFRNVDK